MTDGLVCDVGGLSYSGDGGSAMSGGDDDGNDDGGDGDGDGVIRRDGDGVLRL
nr:hypothetical protein [Tanacetum cinerariifolium]